MQPSTAQTTLTQDIKTLADWVYEQFRPTDPMEVQNILDKQYYFKYCVGETIDTPDQVSRKVMDRQYEEITFEPGETKVLMGGAAYIFLCGIAPHYVLQTKNQDAMGDLQTLVDAAALAIIGKVQYSKHAEPIGRNVAVQPVKTVTEPTPPADHNPNVVKDDEGNLPTQTTGDDDAFANIGSDDRFKVVPAGESEDGSAHFFVDGKEVTNTEYNEAHNEVVPAGESEDGSAHFFVDGKEVTNTEYNEVHNAAAKA